MLWLLPFHMRWHNRGYWKEVSIGYCFQFIVLCKLDIYMDRFAGQWTICILYEELYYIVTYTSSEHDVFLWSYHPANGSGILRLFQLCPKKQHVKWLKKSCWTGNGTNSHTYLSKSPRSIPYTCLHGLHFSRGCVFALEQQAHPKLSEHKQDVYNVLLVSCDCFSFGTYYYKLTKFEHFCFASFMDEGLLRKSIISIHFLLYASPLGKLRTNSGGELHFHAWPPW